VTSAYAIAGKQIEEFRAVQTQDFRSFALRHHSHLIHLATAARFSSSANPGRSMPRNWRKTLEVERLRTKPGENSCYETRFPGP